MQQDKVKDYKKSVAENQDADDSCFDNALTSLDVETVRKVVQNTEEVSRQFNDDFAMAAK